MISERTPCQGGFVGSRVTVLDQSTNVVVRNTIFEEILPTKCRFARLTMINWPRSTPLGIIELTVFGKPAESLPAAQPIPSGTVRNFLKQFQKILQPVCSLSRSAGRRAQCK